MRASHLALIATAILGASSAAAPPPRVTGVFSDLSYNADGGDLLGLEVFVVAGPGGYFATVQCAEGEPSRPVVTRAEITGTRVRFTLPGADAGCGTAFDGTVSPQGLRGRFAGERTDRWLPRKRSYWQ